MAYSRQPDHVLRSQPQFFRNSPNGRSDLAAPPGDVATVDVVIPGTGVPAGIPVDR